jgi:hypothetical protein
MLDRLGKVEDRCFEVRVLATQLGGVEAVRAADVEHVARVVGHGEAPDRLPRERTRQRAHPALVGALGLLAEDAAVEFERLARAQVFVRARDVVPLVELEQQLVV